MQISEIITSNIFHKNNIKCNFTPTPQSKITCEFSANCINSIVNIIITVYIYCNVGSKHELVESKPKYLSISSSNKHYNVSFEIPDFSGNYESFILIRLNPAEEIEKVVNIQNLRISRMESMKYNEDEDISNIIYDENNIISLYPFVVKESGYGILVDNISDNLPKCGYTVIDMGTDGFTTNSTNISLFITLPTSFFKTSSKFNIGYTMFEATKIPPIWINYCNTMDRLFVPCNANIKAFRASGVTVPIDVIPIGIDTKLYNPELYEPTYDFGMPQFEKAYKFFIFNDGQPRKNNQMVFKAFSEEFYREIAANEVCLVLRQHTPHTERNIIYIKEYLEDNKLASLIRSCDSMISASSGEAGDIPILTGMSMGKPVIVTKEFVHPDYVEDNKTGYFIDTESIVPAYTQPEYKDNIGIIKGAEWICPSLTSLKEKMRYVYENRDEAEKVGCNARKFIVENRDNIVCISKMVEVFEKLTGAKHE
ncbi:MAG: glycosyltransferase [Candidatus Omnitrophica bacterium]|nr:glycosyltransferase [Candidatus Omnitrophota bacterium]